MNNAKPCRTTCNAPLCFAILLCLMLAACSSSDSPSPASDVQINQYLVYQHSLTEGDTVKPHQTVALTLPAQTDDHLNAGDRYHQVPYEISNEGMYKFCITENDTHLNQVELHDLTGNLVASWKKGEPCESVPLTPGKYSMHVHLAASNSEPLVFMKPHAVSYTRNITSKKSGKTVASTFDGQIPENQFKNLRVASLSDILLNGAKEWWGVVTPLSSDTAKYHTLTPYQGNSASHTLKPSTKLQPEVLLQFKGHKDNEGNQSYTFRQGMPPQTGGFVNLFRNCLKQDCTEYDYRLALQQPDPKAIFTVTDLFDFTPITTDNLGFNLRLSGREVVSWNKNSNDWVVGSGTEPVEFRIKVRYGTAGANFIPPMLATEVALFDAAYGQAGFPDNTHYWIINADLDSFSDFAFNDPTNRIKTVIAGRGVRAKLFQYPNCLGASVYVSPPAGSEIIMTATDHSLLNAGTVGSVKIEANTNDMSTISFEHHIVISSHSCIGCDLRGFDGTSLSSEVTNGMNFNDSDLSYARFTRTMNFSNPDMQAYLGGMISHSSFLNTTFNNALLRDYGFVATDFSKATFAGADLRATSFESCTFTNTDFSHALTSGINFSFDATVATSDMAFYNACPKFEYTDLTTVSGIDSYFPVGPGSFYNSETWWNKHCRVSLAHSRVNSGLFKDKRLWQFVDAPGVDFSNQNLDGAVFAGSNLAKANFTNASLIGAVFTMANLAGADFTGADLTGAHLDGAVLQSTDPQTGAIINQVELYKAKTLSGAFLSGVTLTAPNLSNLDMSGATLNGGSYTNWDGHLFPGVNTSFSAASLNGAYMFNTKLNGANLSNAYLEKVSWFGQYATGENATMERTKFILADLPGINLKQAKLEGADFTNSVLVNADLSNKVDQSFNDTNFYNANLNGANLDGVNLNGARLEGAYVYSGPKEQTIILEVLDDPTTNPGHYRFFYQNYKATKAPASTDGTISCPNGGSSPEKNDCGDLSSPFWIRKGDPAPPEPICLNENDLGTCQSQRHPVTK